MKKLKDFFYFVFYPSETERKAIYLFIFMILIGDVYMRFFTGKNKEREKIEKIDINLADFEDFVNVPGIGSRIAAKILDYRDKKGEIMYPEELKEIKGIGDKKINILKKYFKFPYDYETDSKSKKNFTKQNNS